MEFAHSFRMFSALALLPPELAPCGFDLLFDKYASDERFTDFMSYFENNFVGRPMRANNSSRSSPRFPIEQWNQYDYVLSDINRTNNRVEGWNRRVRDLADCTHPHVYKLIEVLKKDMTNTSQILIEARTGQEPEPQRMSYRNVTDGLKNIIASANFTAVTNIDRDILGFLSNVAMVIKY